VLNQLKSPLHSTEKKQDVKKSMCIFRVCWSDTVSRISEEETRMAVPSDSSVNDPTCLRPSLPPHQNPLQRHLNSMQRAEKIQ